MITDDILRRVLDVFDVHTQRYAVGRPKPDRPDKYSYYKVDEPLTFDVLRRHLEGEVTIGVYPVKPDHTTKWFAVDYDAPKDIADDKKFPGALQAARTQQQVFTAAGLFTYIERSRSGTGVHLWGFLREPMEAEKVRHVVLKLLRPELDLWVDRAKTYPADPTKSDNQTLICLPYGGTWVAKGCTMFLKATTNEPWPLEEFLGSAKINANEVVAEIYAKLPKARVKTASPSYAGSDGRPDPLFDSGIMKIFSPVGCQFLHHTWADRHERGDRRVTEPEWYAALGQLSAFANGRQAAHLLWGDTQYYNPEGMDQKFDHACNSAPNGCASIHEKFPRWACAGCPMTAPYRLAEKPLLDLTVDSVGSVESGQYADDRARIQRRNSGRELPGIDPGVPGLGEFVRLRNTELVAVGAQPSIGKTALMIDMSCNISRAGVEVYMFSAESSRDAVHERLLAHESGIDSRALRGERPLPLQPHEWEALDVAIEGLKKLPLYENYAATRPDDILRLIEADRLRRGAPWGAPFVVLFDYLQYGLAVPPGESGEYRAINQRLQELKALRKVLDRPVVFFSQLTRDTEGKDDPAMNWWSGSGKIEMTIDQGWIITGERVEGPVAPRTIHIVKQKEGVVGVKKSYLLRQAVCRFEDSTRAAEPEDPSDPLFDTWDK